MRAEARGSNEVRTHHHVRIDCIAFFQWLRDGDDDEDGWSGDAAAIRRDDVVDRDAAGRGWAGGEGVAGCVSAGGVNAGASSSGGGNRLRGGGRGAVRAG